MRLSHRLSRLSQAVGKSRRREVRDRLARPYVVGRACLSLSDLGDFPNAVAE